MSITYRPIATHSRVECSCGRVIVQCRCMGPKTVVVRPHPACGQESES